MNHRRFRSVLVLALLIGVMINLSLPTLSLAQGPDDGQPTRPPKAGPPEASGEEFAPAIPAEADASSFFNVPKEEGPITAVILLEGEPAGAFSASPDMAPSEAAFGGAMRQASGLRSTQNSLRARLAADLNIQTLGHLVYVANGLVVNMDASQIDEVEALPGVAAVYPDSIGHLDLTNSVPFIGAPDAWLLGSGYTGDGIRVGIIDSGIDYTHANFGGSGDVNRYTRNLVNNHEDITDIGYDGSKVVGGYDFVGTDWAGGNPLAVVGTGIPLVPGGWAGPAYTVGDNDPIDCNGHGSHVSGIAAGYGVDDLGNTYAGAYPPADFSIMTIGPGVAPEAELYALKIGGCSTAVSFAAGLLAVDFAMDPNGDGNMTDHLDVINNSYGGDYGSLAEPLTQAFDLASGNGVVVVGSGGNAADTYFVAGDPNIAPTSISVASSVVDTLYGGLEVTTGPGGAYPSYPTVIPANASQSGALGVYGPAALRVVGGAGNSQGCNVADYTGFAGEVGLITWSAAPSGCGSGTRMTNAVNAGGVAGLVVISANPADFPFISLACSFSGGPSPLPCVSILATDGNILDDAPGSFTVTFDDSLTTTLTDSLADTLSSFSSRGPANDSSAGEIWLKPDVTAPGDLIYSTAVGTGNQALGIGGTSMAAPHVTGMAALLRELHPTWSPAQIKALVMNTATHDLWTGINQTGDNYGVSRVGAGRVDIGNAVRSDVIAYSASHPERVSVSYGLIEVVDQVSQNQSITVRNLGTASQTYNISFQTINDVSGTNVSVSPASVTVGAGSTRTLTVTLTANKANMVEPHLPDPTTPETQAGAFGNQPRHWFGEEGGYVVLDAQTSTPDLRVPVHAVVRPASDMAAESPLTVGPGSTGSAPLYLAGDEIYTGTNLPYDIWSQVTAFDLVYERPAPPNYGDFGDDGTAHYIGVTSDFPARLAASGGNVATAVANTTVYFAIATYGDWNNATGFDSWFEVGVDSDENGSYNATVFNFETGYLVNADWTDTAMSWVTNGGSWLFGVSPVVAATFVNEWNAATIDTYVMNTNVFVLPVRATRLGLNGTNTAFNFDLFNLKYFYILEWIPTTPPFWFSYDIAAPTYSFTDLGGLAGGPYPGISMWNDFDGSFIPVDYDLTAYGAGPYPDIMLVHHHNAGDANRVQLVPVQLSNDVEIDVNKTVDQPQPTPGTNVTFTIEVTNNGPAEAGDLVIVDELPAPLVYVSDTCPGLSTVAPQPDGSTLITCDMTGSVLPYGFTVSYDIVATVPLGIAEGRYVNEATLTGWRAGLDMVRPDGAAGGDNDRAAICIGTVCEPDDGTGGEPGTGGGPAIVVFDPSVSKAGALQAGALGLPGEELTWTLVISNVGSAPGTNIVVVDEVRPEMRVDGASIDTGTYTINGNQVTFTIPTLNPGQSVQAQIFTTVVTSPADGTLENTATVQGTGPNGLATDSGSAVVAVPSQLPSTGYPPDGAQGRTTTYILIVVSAGLLALVAAAWVVRRSYSRA